mmetsp:Transcript_8187/g.25481  ORF Transcript_8187/g.25481 Transcript_8187/m.25481 type:complete len:596 (+) Transcript_8187:70-1857(+)
MLVPGSASPAASAGSGAAVARQVALEEGRVRRRVRLHLGDHVQPWPLVLPVHELAGDAVLGRMQARHGGSTRSQLPTQVQVRAAEELGLPAGDVLEADALRQILAAENGCCCCKGLRPVPGELGVNHSELDEVVSQAEALLCPARLPQVAAQEGVRRRLVHLEAQLLLHLARHVPHVLGGARTVRHEGQPRGQLRVTLLCTPAVESGRCQGAGHAGELKLRPPHVVHREVYVEVCEGAEEEVLGVRLAVQRHRRVAARVHLRDPVEEDCSHPASSRRHRRGRGSAGKVQLEEDLALGRGEQGRLAVAAQLVAPEIELLERGVRGHRRCNGPRADVGDAVVPQREPPDRRARAEHRSDRQGAGVADAVAAQTELSNGGVLWLCERPGHRTSAPVAQPDTAQLLIRLEGRGEAPLEAAHCRADRTHAGAVCKCREPVHEALQELAWHFGQPQPHLRRGGGGDAGCQWGCGRRPRWGPADRVLDDPGSADCRCQWATQLLPGAHPWAGSIPVPRAALLRYASGRQGALRGEHRAAASALRPTLLGAAGRQGSAAWEEATVRGHLWKAAAGNGPGDLTALDNPHERTHASRPKDFKTPA